MKNISRRVFIKGLAVAGVAAAASTVLAGCNTNMIPGVGDNTDDQPEVENPTTDNVLSFEDADGNTLTITASGLVVGNKQFGTEEDGKVTLKFYNKMGEDLFCCLNDNMPASSSGSLKPAVATDGYFVTVKAYADGDTSKVLTLTEATLANATTEGIVEGGSEYDVAINLDKDVVSKSVSLKIEVQKVLDATVATPGFKSVAEKVVTYSL